MKFSVKIAIALLGAAVCSSIQAQATTAVVTTANPQGWAFSNLDNSGSNASGQFVSGPSTPPLGSGSAQFIVGGTTSSEILYSLMGAGTRLSDITTLAYSTYVATSSSSGAPTLSFDISYNGETTYSGRLVFDPGLLGAVPANTWQTWDTEATASKAWYFSRNPGFSVCQLNNGSYCTLAQVEAAFPNITINDVIFKAGSGQTSFNGNVDALQFGTAAGTTTVDFEAAVPEPASAGLLAMGMLGLGLLRRREQGRGEQSRTAI